MKAPASHSVEFDSIRMTRHMHHAPGFEKVLHVAHKEWHGIRQATAYGPGRKALIPADSKIGFPEFDALQAAIEREGVDTLVFQGFSFNSDEVLKHIRARFGPDLKIFAITHVTTSQFEHHFEVHMQERLLNRRRYGMIDGLASVKPGFHNVFGDYWKGTILNYAPNLPMDSFPSDSKRVEIYSPLNGDWRKNVYTNVIAAMMARNVDLVKTAHYPNELDRILSVEKLRVLGFLHGDDLLAEMANSALVLMATLAECQPMTQLEALAVGTPSLTGPLQIDEFAGDPLSALCTSDKLDNPGLLSKDIERLVDARLSDPDGMREMIADHLAKRHRLANQHYADFLGL